MITYIRYTSVGYETEQSKNWDLIFGLETESVLYKASHADMIWNELKVIYLFHPKFVELCKPFVSQTFCSDVYVKKSRVPTALNMCVI